MTFSVCQTIAAFIAGSEAMMGDSAAMIVDALTYLFNLIAERKKKTFILAQQQEQLRCTSDHPGLAQKLRVLKYKRYLLQLELISPLLSVSTLLVVTAFVLHAAIHVLVLDATRETSEQADPNIHIMMLFSVLNLLLDGLNIFCFAKAKHAFGYNTQEEPDRPRPNRRRKASAKPLIDRDKLDPAIHSLPRDDSSNSLPLDSLIPMEIEAFRSEADMDDDEHANLNMCSAYTVRFKKSQQGQPALSTRCSNWFCSMCLQTPCGVLL
jgi:Co/Zn/Cd efflux system component